jgi:hypothetical protein
MEMKKNNGKKNTAVIIRKANTTTATTGAPVVALGLPAFELPAKGRSLKATLPTWIDVAGMPTDKAIETIKTTYRSQNEALIAYCMQSETGASLPELCAIVRVFQTQEKDETDTSFARRTIGRARRFVDCKYPRKGYKAQWVNERAVITRD